MSEQLRALALAAMATESSADWYEHAQAFDDACTPAAILALLDEMEDSHKAYELLFKECGRLRNAVDAVEVLIGNSDGVSGLHLNGDDAPWDSLRTGGRFESWLMALDDAAKGESNA
jgi:hypothetical protein